MLIILLLQPEGWIVQTVLEPEGDYPHAVEPETQGSPVDPACCQ